MKIFTTDQLKAWDNFTIKNEPIASIDLMERAALNFTAWFKSFVPVESGKVYIFCGPGNNGGDGLAIARLLRNLFYEPQVYLCKITTSVTEDFKTNLERLKKYGDVAVYTINENDSLPLIPPESIIIDSIFGIGIKRPITGYWGDLISFLNRAKSVTRIAVDMPSGLPVDGYPENICFEAQYTCTFHCPKPSFFYIENEKYCGQWSVAEIGLSEKYHKNTHSDRYFTDPELIKSIFKKRSRFEHKGNFGHCLIIAGSKGKAGAAVLTARACIKSGAGLVTALLPEYINNIMQTSVPEVMTLIEGNEKVTRLISKKGDFDVIGIGPGLGTANLTINFFQSFLKTNETPLVLDADALNILAKKKNMFSFLPKHTILTPHPKEFERLFGKTKNSKERIELQLKMSQQYNVIIVLKGAYSSISIPDGNLYINPTGNPGMASAGSGDVLTGILTSLIGQGYDPVHAAILGVYLHGLAGDLALKNQSTESLIASDIIDNLGYAFQTIHEF